MRRALCFVLSFVLGAFPALADTVTVTARRANVRARPSTSGAVVSTVTEGTRLEIESREGEWFKVRPQGYIHTSLVRLEAAAPPPAEAVPAPEPAAAPPAPGIAITHEAVACLEAERFPRLDACFDPAEGLSRARVQFRAVGTPHWYFVEMKPETACFSGILPRPNKSTTQIEYYVEAVNRSFVETRTEEFQPRVTTDSGGCKGKIATALSSASVVVGSTSAAAPAVPAGFSTSGLVAAAAGTPAGTASSSTAGGTTPAEGSAATHGGLLAGKGLLLAGAAVAVVGGVVLATKGTDPLKVDDDGDGLSEAEGDCNDTNRNVSPNGGFEFTMDFANSGAVSCSAANARQQTYRVTNNSCTPLTIQSLQVVGTTSGICSGTLNASQPLLINTVASGTTTVIRQGAGAGTVRAICCGRYPCVVGTCTLSLQYTLNTSAGVRTLNNSYTITDNTGRDCPVCGSGPQDETLGAFCATPVGAN